MTDGKKKLKRKARPLLVAGAGIALVSFGATGCFTSGNLIAPPCRGQELPDGTCPEDVDAGTSDGGTPDGGVLGGDQ